MSNPAEDKIITLETYYDVMLAHIMRTKLEDNGIPCFIADESLNALGPLYNQAVGGIKLKVFERDLERSREILATEGDLHEQDHIEIDEETNNAIICPFCASTNIGPADPGKFSVFLSTVFPFYNTKAWHCFNCLQDFE
ncbi:Putative signal transducing protein [Mucilaginibacter sp. OK268]|uniref:putative signal transducing protein n=1 Tax=Mucilaginibacter sp. OK268 TaxID=1881048 RepID=UPI000890F4CC|nr:DUF2007 domain-containing protein [Mucilaginibacter sp. OK268]SDP81593.1 Putative signal transducing protein [Mucilaginibacter sp. OK268]